MRLRPSVSCTRRPRFAAVAVSSAGSVSCLRPGRRHACLGACLVCVGVPYDFLSGRPTPCCVYASATRRAEGRCGVLSGDWWGNFFKKKWPRPGYYPSIGQPNKGFARAPRMTKGGRRNNIQLMPASNSTKNNKQLKKRDCLSKEQ